MMSKVFFRADLLHGVACAPKSMKASVVEEYVRAEHPSGTTQGWRLSKKKTLEDGTKLPAPCLEDRSRRHHLFEC